MKNEISAEFISAHMDGPTGAAIETQTLDRFNGQQRMMGLSEFTGTAPKTTIADVMAITALLGKGPEEQQPRAVQTPKPRMH